MSVFHTFVMHSDTVQPRKNETQLVVDPLGLGCRITNPFTKPLGNLEVFQEMQFDLFEDLFLSHRFQYRLEKHLGRVVFSFDFWELELC